MVMRWNDWQTDGAAIYLADTVTYGTVAVRAFDEYDAKARLLRHYGDISLVDETRPWSPSLPHRGAFSPTVVLDIDGMMWGLSRDEPYRGADREIIGCAGDPLCRSVS